MRHGIAMSGKRTEIFFAGLRVNKRGRRDEKECQTERARLTARLIALSRRRMIAASTFMRDHLLRSHVRATIRIGGRNFLCPHRRDQHGQGRAQKRHR